MKNKIAVSIILPTFNEDENLKSLIPELDKSLSKIQNLDFEIIVVDDNSTDNTKDVVNNIMNEINFVRFHVRSGKASLPLSIYEGISLSNYEYVLWMDADRSMPAEVAGKLIERLYSSKDKVIIGSRFVEGGGYKGVEKDGSSSLIRIIKNLYKSEDSLLAVLLSKIFNRVLIFLINSKVKDITSGFIVGKKEYFSENSFSRANYGDYFVYLISDLQRKGVEFEEIGYICLTRQYGKSKTANNIFDLTLKGWPYIKAAFVSRIE